MKKNSHSYLSPKLEARPRSERGGYGVYTRQPIEKGELLSVWGGKVTEAGEFSRLTEFTQRRSIQVEEDLYLVPVIPQEPADFVNHCCDPNAGMSGQIALVAIRDIQAGEEICYDYAMSDGSPYDEFECNCGAPNCRGRVTGDNWRDAELQEKYAGYFSPYLQRRIDQMQVK
jgi:SET domain-containing protein